MLAFASANAVRLIPILTKADKCARNERQKRQKEWTALLPCPPIVTSSADRTGLDELWQAMRDMAG